jgi:signal recognition particle subunit SRP54
LFSGLTRRLQDILGALRGHGRLSEEDLNGVLRTLRIALLEADVNVEAARSLVDRVRERATAAGVLASLTPDQVLTVALRQEMSASLGGKPVTPVLEGQQPVWFMVGLQGTGKTTAAAKVARLYQQRGRRPLLVAGDTQRPQAQEQLEILGREIGVPVVKIASSADPAGAKRALQAHLKSDYRDLILVDTAGRLQIDEDLMNELAALKGALQPTATLLVVDAMMGQEALGVARTFDERIGVTGLVLTKLDADSRGGAALSARHVTGKPILFAGVSEKTDGLEPFNPERLASRILDLGDIEGLLEKVQRAAGPAKPELKRPDQLTMADLLGQLKALKDMGGAAEAVKMLPGAARMIPDDSAVGEGQLVRIEAIINSMTLQERADPRLLNASRRKRIAAGSGTTVQEINQLVKMYDQIKTLAKQAARGRRGGPLAQFFGR